MGGNDSQIAPNRELTGSLDTNTQEPPNHVSWSPALHDHPERVGEFSPPEAPLQSVLSNDGNGLWLAARRVLPDRIVLTVGEAMTGPQNEPTEWSVGLVLFVAFIFSWTAFWLFTGVSAYWLGRLELYEDRALLPRIGLAPWSYLSLHELALNKVIRWGVGMQRVRSGSVAVLMIEAPHTSQDDRKIVRRIVLSMYPQESRQQIVEYFTARLDQPTELQSCFGGLAFPKSE